MSIDAANGWLLKIESVATGIEEIKSIEEPELVDISGRCFIKTVSNNVWTHTLISDDVVAFSVEFDYE
jgi:hypothetical protein